MTMTESLLAPVQSWLATPMAHDVSEAITRLRRAPDVQRIAVMPDVHLAADVCVGVVVATSHLLYPQAVGGDIGCGMLAVALDLEAASLKSPRVAGQVLRGIGRAVPARRHKRQESVAQPENLTSMKLSHPRIDSKRCHEGATEFATLGSGNHFIELQTDEDGRLWMMVHSGSRAIGPAIRDHHLANAEPVGSGLRALDVRNDQGAAYLNDVLWARRFADASRQAMAEKVGDVLGSTLGGQICWETAIMTDHNHVAFESHGGCDFWVHRKGAMSAQRGESGVLPGSMGTPSFHVEGRGLVEALCSSAHGAGRLLSRTEARRKITVTELHRQMDGIWHDYRLSDKLRDEAPTAYKDIRAVVRAQKDLVKIIRILRPVLSYKGL